MVYRETAVHDDGDAGRLELAGHVVVPDALLHPDESGLDLEQGIQ
jgi:hypothetical protein